MDNPLQGAIQNAIQKMGSNFLVAAFVPAMAFIVVSFISFQPILPSSYNYVEGDATTFLQSSLILILFTTILGFTLYSISTYTYKSFEGYTFILGKESHVRRLFLKRQAIRYYKIINIKNQVEKQLEKVAEKIDAERNDPMTGKWRNRRLTRYIQRQKTLTNKKYILTSELDAGFPTSPEFIMPTRFGNILRAAELYPNKRYGIDAVPLWGRLAFVMPIDGMEKVNEANNQCQFLLNATLLSVIFSMLNLFASMYQGIVWWAKITNNSLLYFIIINREPYVYQQRIWLYLTLAILALAMARFFYETSLFNVTQMGETIRVSYDVYRFTLLKALHLELPKSLKEEKKVWNKVSHFMTGNLDYMEEENLQDEIIDFAYNHWEEKSQSKMD